MCQATVFVGDRVVAEEVTGLEQNEEGVRIMAFFEPPKIVPGRILHVDFLKHRVFLEPIEREE
jgi:predicted RNA-binding protein